MHIQTVFWSHHNFMFKAKIHPSTLTSFWYQWHTENMKAAETYSAGWSVSGSFWDMLEITNWQGRLMYLQHSSQNALTNDWWYLLILTAVRRRHHSLWYRGWSSIKFILKESHLPFLIFWPCFVTGHWCAYEFI